MPKYLLLKRYRGGPEPHRPVPPIDQWAPEDVEAHMAFQHHVSELLEENGEYVDARAPAARPARMADDGRDPAARRCPPQRGRARPPRGGGVRRAAAGTDRGGRRRAVRPVLLLPPRARARLPGGADAARRRRPDHPG